MAGAGSPRGSERRCTSNKQILHRCWLHPLQETVSEEHAQTHKISINAHGGKGLWRKVIRLEYRVDEKLEFTKLVTNDT